MLAAMEGIPYQDHEITIQSGDRIFLYTDGVTEATNTKNELYGEERLIQTLKENLSTETNPKKVLELVRADIDKFVNGASQFDDITMLDMIFKAKSVQKAPLEMKITASDSNMDRVNDFIHSCLPESCDSIILNQIDLAVEEIFVNISHYAYNPENGDAHISADFTDNTLTIVFKDFGKQFNPIAKEDPDITLSAEERKIGGLGIFLTKKFMDEVDYEYKDNQNILTLKKTIS